MEKFNLIWALISTFLAAGGVVIIKNFIKESKELVASIKEAKSDGNISAKEARKIVDEALDVYEEGLKLWNIIKKTLPKKK